DSVVARLAEAENAAAAHLETGSAHFPQRVETILERAGRDDARIERLGRVEVVVVVVESRLGQALGLPVPQEPQRRARFQPESLDLADHLEDRLELAVLRTAVRRAHAEPGRTGGAGALGGSP